MYDPHPNARSCNFDKWLKALSDASDKIRFECCPHPHGEPQYITERYKVTVAYQELIRLSLQIIYIYTIQDLQKITGQSAKDDPSLEAPVIAEESNRAFSLSYRPSGEVVARFSRIT